MRGIDNTEVSGSAFVPYIDESKWVAVGQSIAQGGTYTAPADGVYLISAAATDAGHTAQITNSAGTFAFVTSPTGDGQSSVGVLPLKQGYVLKARASYGSYRVQGYFAK